MKARRIALHPMLNLTRGAYLRSWWNQVVVLKLPTAVEFNERYLTKKSKPLE
jgi:hypothetical protein